MVLNGENPGFQHDPLVLLVPDRGEADRPAWQQAWAARREDVRTLDLGGWDNPHRNTWVNKLNLAVYRAGRPVVLVGHRLGCVAIAWWAEFEQPRFGNPVVSALLVSPPDLDRPGRDVRLARFGNCPRKPLPFSSFLVASDACSQSASRLLARDWGCRFVDAGEADVAKEEASFGEWRMGEALLRRLLNEHAGVRRYVSERPRLAAAQVSAGL